MPRPSVKAALLISFIMLAAASARAANLAVPLLEIITKGGMDGGSFSLDSRVHTDILMEGGVKFGGKLGFSFDSDSIEDAILSGGPLPLGFRSAQVTVRDIFSLPLDLNFFVGQGDLVCDGGDFPARFGSVPFATSLKGYTYFPKGVGGEGKLYYEGLHRVSGTGLSLIGNRNEGGLVPAFYLYQDGNIGSGGVFSFDARLLANLGAVKIDAFGGATFPASLYGLYRAGLLFFVSGTIGEFYAQIGMTMWDPAASLGIDNFYFLFEPRIKLGFGTVIITLFNHPRYYMQKAYDSERGSTDVNFNILFGELSRDTMQGGVETSIAFRSTQALEQLGLKVSPYFSFASSGIRWDLKLNLNVLPWDVNRLITAFVGIRTEF